MQITRLLFLKLTLVCLVVVCGALGATSISAPVAKILLVNAKVYSLDWNEPALDGSPAKNAPYKNGRWSHDADSIAIADGKVLFVGERQAAERYLHKSTEVVNLEGATVIPGLIDSHVHIAELGETLQRTDLSDVGSPAAAVARLKAAALGLSKNEWLIGQGWDEGAWANNYPNLQMLDAEFPDRPVYLRSLHGFAVWVNSRALVLAGVDENTVAPVGGEIIKDADGLPTGILLNRATTLVADKLPKPSVEKFADYIRAGLQKMAQDGFVAVHEAGAESLHIEALQGLQEKGELPIRMYAMLSARDQALSAEWLAKGPLTDPDGFLDIRSVKAYYDGALGSRGARLIEDYSDLRGHRGVSGTGYGYDSAVVDKLIDAGFQVGIHAIGDAGNREVLDYFEKAAKRSSNSARLRHRVEHAQVIQADDFKRFAELGLLASMQPPHAVEDKAWAEDRLGLERIKGAYAWRALRENGVPLTFNSDLPGSDHSIFYGLHAAITRRDKSAQPREGWYAEQTVRIEEAIRGYTSWAAYAAFRETQTGTLKPGHWADITVMDIDPFALSESDPQAILDGEILMTIVNGKIIFDSVRDSRGVR